jgi:hypothetical protein
VVSLPLELIIISLRLAAIAATVATFSLAGFAAPAPGDHAAHHPQAAASAASGMPMADRAGMDAQMKAMHEMHEKMAQATTPEERSALMTEHMKAMQDGMAMMDKDAMPKMGKGAMKGKPPNMAMRQAMMEKRMDMMQSMMQMMMMDHMQQHAQMAGPAATR